MRKNKDVTVTVEGFHKVSIVMGSKSDYSTMKLCEKVLKILKVNFETNIVSAHRTPKRMFKFAKSLGDELIVGLDTDEKVKESKGSDRPFNNLEDRELVVSSIRYVDKTISFNSQKQLEDLIKTICFLVLIQ